MIYILYGSQTGNAESIAKDLGAQCQDMEIECSCLCLNDAKKISIKDDAKFLIVVCSTTGNGDAPENADSWWRSIKLRSASKELFLNVPYSVLGLGDTNYDKFCHMGKSIDKRLSELGAKQEIELFCADEATNLEETVEKWKKAIIPILTKYNSNSIDGNSSTTISTNDNTNIKIEINELKKESGLPDNVMSVFDVSSWFGINDIVISTPNSSDLPKVKIETSPTLEYVGESNGINNINNISQNNSSSSVDFWNVLNPYEAKIFGAKYLTKHKISNNQTESEWEEERKVIHMEISLGDSNITYFPGDSIGICCPNPKYIVDLVFERLIIAEASPQFTLSSLYKNKKGEVLTVNEMLYWKLDLVGLPKKAAVMTLSQFCKDEKEKIAMQWLCSKDNNGKKLWTQTVEAQVIGIGELLAMFPSCCPTLSLLASILNPLPPRYYSIASSPLVRGNRLTVAFSVVRYTCCVTEPSINGNTIEKKIRRVGICTSYLENLLECWLKPLNQANEICSIRMFHKPTIHFRLPGSVTPPIILIGPGTGVAPFIGFLEHRSALEKEREKSIGQTCMGTWRGGFELEEKDLPTEGNRVDEFCSSSSPGPVWLYFGCRNDDDFLYKEELELRIQDKTLSHLSVSMSRVTAEKIYVTHKILENRKVIANFLLNEGGYIYICGDGNKMAKDVHTALVQVLCGNGCEDEESAKSFLEELKTRRRYILDIWS